MSTHVHFPLAHFAWPGGHPDLLPVGQSAVLAHVSRKKKEYKLISC